MTNSRADKAATGGYCEMTAACQDPQSMIFIG